jgi:Ca-activated chloride channel family protein
MHEHNAPNEAQITLHDKLCAYILGEADDDERAEIERALESSSELRAERDRLELTIGFVRDALTDVEKLSPEATAEVLSAVGAKKPRPWYFSNPMRIAAGIAAVTIAYAVYENRDTMPVAERVAQLDSSSRSRPDLSQDGSALDSRGKFSKERPEQSPSDSPRISGEKLAAATPPAERASAPRAEARDDKDAESHLLAAAGNQVNQGKGQVTPTEPAAVSAETGAPVIDRTPPARALHPADEAAELAQNAESFESGGTAIGVGSGGSAAAKGKETYRGPGDTAVGASGPASPGPSGPSTGGPQGAPSARPAGPVLGEIAGSFAGRRMSSGSNRIAPSSSVTSLSKVADGSEAWNSSNLQGGAQKSESEQRLRGLGYVDDASGRDDYYVGQRKQAGAGGEADMLEELKKYRPEHHKYQEILDELSRRNLTPEQREQLIDTQCRLILERCHRQPNERPRDMYFRFWGDNAFQIAALEAQSTFSVDVDTASYALARRYLNEGNLPEKAQVRTEEFINYFKPDVAPPREGTFAIQTELAPSRFSNDAGRTMLRVAVRGREVTKQERKPLALTFVIDCSGSMQEQGRLEMVKHAIRLLVNQLDANDSIAIVAFSSDARLILPMTSAARRHLIESALFPLKPENSTNSEAGLRMGFEAALAGINSNANNRVVFLSDGVANVGETDPEKLAGGVKRIREKGIYLNSIGVGMNNHNDTLLEQLADKGDGVCNYIDSLDEAKRVMVDNFTGAMETIAREVKIQVEFDPAQVYRYRLLGYENRFIANQDFRNDKVDAGEVGAGHQVCALYELELANPTLQAAALAGKLLDDAAQKPLATVRLRWKAPRDVRHPDANEEATEIAKPVLASQMTSYEGSSFGYKRAVVVAQFAEFLRRSTHARGRSFDDLLAEAKKLEKEAADPEFSELVALLEKSRSLILANLPQCDELCQTIDIVRRNQILRAEHDMLSNERDQKALDELARQNAELEARIRELLRRKLEEKTK